MSSEDQDNLPQGEESTTKRGRKPADNGLEEKLKAAEERIFNLEQAMYRIAHVSGALQFCEQYNIKKVPQ